MNGKVDVRRHDLVPPIDCPYEEARVGPIAGPAKGMHERSIGREVGFDISPLLGRRRLSEASDDAFYLVERVVHGGYQRTTVAL